MKNNPNDLLGAILAATAMAAMSGEAEATPQSEQTTQPKKTIREQSAEKGKSLYEAYQGFMDAGFNEEQAFQLVINIFN